jgi:HEAT repeat protein
MILEQSPEKVVAVPREHYQGLSSTAADVPILVCALKDEDPGTRCWAALKLGWMGPAAHEAVPAIIAALRDGYHDIRLQATFALRRIGPSAHTAVPALFAALRDDPSFAVIHGANEALLAIGPAAESAIPTIVEALEDSNSYIRFAAVQSLKIMGPTAYHAIPAVIKMLQHGKETEPIWAAQVLEAIGPAAHEAVPALTDALQNGPVLLRMEAAYALGAIGTAANPSVPALITALGEDDDTVRQRGTSSSGILEANSTPAVPARSLSGNEPHPFIQTAVIRALMQMGPSADSAIPGLVARWHCLEDEGDPFWFLQRIVSYPTWQCDPQLLEFAPHLLVSLFRPGHIPMLADLSFFQKVQKRWLRKVGVPGRPADLLADAFQEFSLRLLNPRCQQFATHPDGFCKLPGLVRNLARETAVALLRFYKRDEVSLDVQIPTHSRVSFGQQSVVVPSNRLEQSVVETVVLRELSQKLYDHIFMKRDGLKQALLIQNVLRKVAYHKLSMVIPEAKNVRRTLDAEIKLLLHELCLPDRQTLDLLADFLVQEFMVGVIPDAMLVDERE